jgi:uncharacterized protein YecT (DUF1311 family)
VRLLVSWSREETVPHGARVVVAGAIGAVLLGHGPLRAQEVDEPEPCTSTVRLGQAQACWAREAEHADVEMRQAYLTALAGLPSRAADALKKAQKLWLEFRDAHVATLFGVPDPVATYGPEYPMCLSIARWRLTRDRTRELKRLLRRDEDDVCPL